MSDIDVLVTTVTNVVKSQQELGLLPTCKHFRIVVRSDAELQATLEGLGESLSALHPEVPSMGETYSDQLQWLDHFAQHTGIQIRFGILPPSSEARPYPATEGELCFTLLSD